jgi:hypothetical protein
MVTWLSIQTLASHHFSREAAAKKGIIIPTEIHTSE